MDDQQAREAASGEGGALVHHLRVTVEPRDGIVARVICVGHEAEHGECIPEIFDWDSAAALEQYQGEPMVLAEFPINADINEYGWESWRVLAALPVAPEQPTRANEEEQEALEERLDALLVPLIQQFEVDSESDGLNYRRSISLADALGADIARDIAVEARVVLLAALVSSPSVETVNQNAASVNAGVVLAALDALLEDWTLHPRAEASAMKLGVRKLRDQVAQQSVTPVVDMFLLEN